MAVQHVALKPGADLEGFRNAARLLLARGVEPNAVIWDSDEHSLPLGSALGSEDAPQIMLSRTLVELVQQVVLHRDPERYLLLYTLLWRVLHGEPALLEVISDPLVHRLQGMRKSVRRDIHKMHAFLRFRSVTEPDGDTRYVAWFEPEHHILAAVAPFFVDRFRSLAWSIFTPAGSLHWDREHLLAGPPAKRSDAPTVDAFEAGWRAYYESVFNPARANPEAMRSHMPKKYWRNLPETAAINDLLRRAPTRVDTMIRNGRSSG